MLVLQISLPVVTDDTFLCLLPSSWYSVLPHQAPSSTYRVPSTSMYVFLAASLLQGIYIDIASRVVVCWHLISAAISGAPLVFRGHYVWGVGVPIVVADTRYTLRC